MRVREIAGEQGALSSLVSTMFGRKTPDSDRVMKHRPDLYGAAFSEWLEHLLRGDSNWSVGERELFASFTSLQQKNDYCTKQHGAVASLELGEDTVHQVWDDFETSTVPDVVKAALRFIAKMTTNPDWLDVSDIDDLRRAGLGRIEVEEVIQICAAMNIIARIASTLAFSAPSWKQFLKEAKVTSKRGYA